MQLRKKRSVRAFKRHPGRSFADLYEGTPSYSAVAYRESGAPFVVLKATEGIGHVDSQHSDRCERSHAAGLAVGHYHFLRPESGRPEWEAKHFWETVRPHFLTEWPIGKGHDKARLSHVDFLIVDVEVGHSTEQIQEALTHFCRELLRVSKVKVGRLIAYTGKAFLFEHNLHVPGDKWWVADYPDFPGKLGGGRELWAHQFTEDGFIPGAGRGDCSVIVNSASIRYWEAQ